MSDDIEQRLGRLTPRGVRPELHEKVLGAVASELEGSNGVPLLGTSSAGRKPSKRHCLFQAVAQVGEKCGPSAKADSPWLRRAAMAVAASLLLGIVLNVWVSKASERRLAQLFGPPPISKGAIEIAKTVETITDAETGQWVYRQFTMPRRAGDAAAAYAKYCSRLKRLINELQTVSKDSYHETPQKDSEMDRYRAGRTGGDSTDCQRRVRLGYRCTA